MWRWLFWLLLSRPQSLVQWEFTAGGSIYGEHAIGNDVLYCGSLDSNFYAMNATTGRMLWSKSPGGDSLDSNTLISRDGRSVFISSHSFLYAFSPTGDVLWRAPINATTSGNLILSLDGQRIFAGYYGTTYSAFNVADGALLWSAGTGVMQLDDGHNHYPSISADGQTLYVIDGPYGVGAYHVTAVDAATGKARWSTEDATMGASMVAVRRAGDFVYANAWADPCGFCSMTAYHAGNGSRAWTRRFDDHLAFGCLLSPSEDELYIGDRGGRIIALDALAGTIRWSSKVSMRWVAPLALSSTLKVIYVSTYGPDFHAISLINGRELWSFERPGLALWRVHVSPDHDRTVFVSSVTGNIFALRWPQAVQVADWGVAGLLMAGALVVTGLLCYRLLSWGGRERYLGSGKRKTAMLFAACGTLWGFVVGAMVAVVLVELPRRLALMQAASGLNEAVWFRAPPSCAMVVFAIVTAAALVWGIVAGYRWTGLDDVCGVVVLCVALAVSFNVVPACALLMRHATEPDSLEYAGSNPWVLSWWCVCSYPLGLTALLLGIGVAEAIFKCTDAVTDWSKWRHHIVLRLMELHRAFFWGFLGFWSSTVITMYLFNRHGIYVPPFTPLGLLGVGSGLLAFAWSRFAAATPSDEFGWTQERATDVKVFVSKNPLDRHRKAVRERWLQLHRSAGIDGRLHPFRVIGLARRVWRPHGKGTLRGSQLTLMDELDWGLVRFSFNTFLVVLPLIIYWLYQRFSPNSGRVLTITPPFRVTDGATGLTYSNFTSTDTLPLRILPVASVSPVPLVIADGASSPFSPCPWSNLTTTIDSGDFNLCVTDATNEALEWVTLSQMEAAASTCLGVPISIIAEPSQSLYFNLQLVVYLAFLMFCVWLTAAELFKKRYVGAAINLGGLLQDSDDHKSRQAKRRQVVTICFLFPLAALYGVCLFLDTVQERFVLMGARAFYNAYMTADVSAANVALQSLMESVGKALRIRGLLLVWMCGGGDEVMEVTYALNAGANMDVVIVQAAYFCYQCYSMLDSKLYDFIDTDAFLALDPHEKLSRKSSYFDIYVSKESGVRLSKENIDEHLHEGVYLPFLRDIHRQRPELLVQLFGKLDADRIVRMLNELPDGDEKINRRESFREQWERSAESLRRVRSRHHGSQGESLGA